MKNLTILAISFSVVFFSCSSTNQLKGIWEFEGIAVGDSLINRFTDQGRAIKTITESHFNTVWVDTNNSIELWHYGLNSGTYTFEDGVYAETFEMFPGLSDAVGLTSYARLNIEGDSFTMTFSDENGVTNNSSATEYWRRIE